MKKNRKKIKLVTSQAIEKKLHRIIDNHFRVLNKTMLQEVNRLTSKFPSSKFDLNS